MPKEIPFNIQDNKKLKTADNPEIKKIRTDNWQYLTANPEMDNLFDDAASGLIKIGEQKFSDSIEYGSFKTKRLSLEKIKEEKAKTIKHFIKKTLFHDLTMDEFDKLYKPFEARWKSGIPTLFREAIYYSTENQGYELSAQLTTSIKFEYGRWYIDTILSEVTFKKDNQTHHLPGTVKSRFALFALAENICKLESYMASHYLLDDLCLKKTVILTSELLDQQLPEYQFEQAVHALNFSITFCEDNRKTSAQAVLDEIKQLKSNGKEITFLTDVLLAANKLMFAPTLDEILAFRQLAPKKSKDSWGNTLANAILCLAGAALVIASSVALGVSLGSSAAVSTIGMVAGMSMMAGGGFLLFKSMKKKAMEENIEEKIKKFVEDAESVMKKNELNLDNTKRASL